MKLNCKPGDLAIIVRSCAGNEGKIVRCIEISHTNRLAIFRDGRLGPPEVWWRTDQIITSWDGRLDDCIRDSQLRPIRDPGDDAQDESKAWLPPVPTQTKELA